MDFMKIRLLIFMLIIFACVNKVSFGYSTSDKYTEWFVFAKRQQANGSCDCVNRGSIDQKLIDICKASETVFNISITRFDKGNFFVIRIDSQEIFYSDGLGSAKQKKLKFGVQFDSIISRIEQLGCEFCGRNFEMPELLKPVDFSKFF